MLLLFVNIIHEAFRNTSAWVIIWPLCCAGPQQMIVMGSNDNTEYALDSAKQPWHLPFLTWHTLYILVAGHVLAPERQQFLCRQHSRFTRLNSASLPLLPRIPAFPACLRGREGRLHLLTVWRSWILTYADDTLPPAAYRPATGGCRCRFH